MNLRRLSEADVDWFGADVDQSWADVAHTNLKKQGLASGNKHSNFAELCLEALFFCLLIGRNTVGK